MKKESNLRLYYFIIFLFLIVPSYFIQNFFKIFEVKVSQIFDGNNKKNFNETLIDEKTKKIMEKANKYIRICRNNILFEDIPNLHQIQKIKITSIITSYNSNMTINTAIRSIQNQNMSELEIIIIDDYSTDNNLEKIRKLQEEDKRIKILKNKENKGPLYNRALGVLFSKAKFIMFLDSDDLFSNEYIFDICYNESIKNNIDILEFSGFQTKTTFLNTSKLNIPLYLRRKEKNKIIKQPELSTFIYKKSSLGKIKKLIDGYLWGKCIKTKIYKKAINLINNDFFYDKIYYSEDRLINFALFRVANSFKFIDEYGIIYYKNNNSNSRAIKDERNCLDDLKNIMNIFYLTNNTIDAEIAAYELIFRWNRTILNGLKKKANRTYLNNLVNLLLNCKYIRNMYKKDIEDLVGQINEDI